MTINEKLTSIAASIGVSQYSLAKQTGLTQPYISRVMSGAKNPTIETLGKLCAALGISMSEFFAEDSQSDPAETEILSVFRQLPDEKKEQLIRVARSL